MEYQHAGGLQLMDPLDASPLVVDTPSASARRKRFTRLQSEAPVVAPSLLLCDFGHLADEVRRLEAAGVKTLHLDVMDGHFVPNMTYGLPIVEAVRRFSNLPIEAHLMISDPARYASQFFAAGADAITFHIEAIADPRPLLDEFHTLGAAAGLAYNPDTPVSAIRQYVDDCDMILTMSVTPGFGGQAFRGAALDNLRQLRAMARPELLLEIDGGVNSETIGQCAAAGAQLFVVGSAIFKTSDYQQAIDTLVRSAKSHARAQ
jgi:ribulose-phosphate 3-epimerase